MWRRPKHRAPRRDDPPILSPDSEPGNLDSASFPADPPPAPTLLTAEGAC
jgi:hypothetical protein